MNEQDPRFHDTRFIASSGNVVADTGFAPAQTEIMKLRAEVRLRDYPQLQLLAWNRRADACIGEADAFALYERNWPHIDEASLLAHERQLIERLTRTFGNGVMNV